MIFLVLAAVVWGSSFPVVTYGLGDVSPLLFVVLRFSAAFLILLARYHSRADLRRLFHRDLILISIPNALAFVLQFKAQEITTASKTALFVNSSPLFVVALSFLLWRQHFGPRQLAAMVVALAGVVITSTRLEFSDLSAINTGDMLCLGVGFSWAVFILSSTTPSSPSPSGFFIIPAMRPVPRCAKTGWAANDRLTTTASTRIPTRGTMRDRDG